ncbi:MAG: NPCBM/NEW2 domain-containing protein [Armatimonadota bacterium]
MAGETSASAEYLSSLRHLFLAETTGWGVIGHDTAAHAPDREAAAISIGGKTYAKGIGHHAPGQLVLDLAGLYDEFLCEVGVQDQGGGSQGSVTFSVIVDGQTRFESGVMREGDPAKPVRVSVRGAQELRLIAGDAGDGLVSDMANWAEARLIGSQDASGVSPSAFDVGRFGELVTCDPGRAEGARTGRTEEYLAEDVFLERPLLEKVAPVWPGGSACAGIVWLERRLLRRLEMELPSGAAVPGANAVRVEAWDGPTLWQGRWRPLSAPVRVSGQTLALEPDLAGEDGWLRAGTRKVRWILPSTDGKDMPFAALKAFSRLRPQETEITLRAPVCFSAPLRVALHNAEVVTEEGQVTEVSWDGEPLTLRLRFIAADYWRSERPALRFRDDGMKGFSIGVDDVLREGAVYAAEAGVLAAAGGSPDIPSYLAGRRETRTILERVREMPEQTFRRALEKTHNPVQDNGPTLLSLACDPRKFIVDQDGSVRFRIEDTPPPEGVARTLKYPARMEIICGEGVPTRRSLSGGWLPAQELGGKDADGVEYEVRTFVVPVGRRVPDSVWLFERSVCVTEIRTSPGSGATRVRLKFSADSDTGADVLAVVPLEDCLLVKSGNRLAAVVCPDGFRCEVSNASGEVILRGQSGAECKAAVLIPGGSFSEEELKGLNNTDLYKSFVDYWSEVMAQAALIEVPDPLLQNVIRASQVHCLIAARSEEQGRRVAPWIASMAYGPLESEANSIIRGMGMLGHRQFAERSLDYFIHRYSPQGFLTTGYTLMGTGWHLWTLGRQYRLTRDHEWLSARADEVARVCGWVIEQLGKTVTPEGLPRVREHGLMTPGVMADWGNYAYYFYLNGYYFAGLQTAGEALADIGHPAAPRILEAASRMREDIHAALERVRSEAPVEPLRDGRWVRPLPSSAHTPGQMGDFFPGEDGNRSWAYDVELGAHHLAAQGVLEPDSEAACAALDLLEDRHFLQSGWFDYPAERNEREWFDLGGFAKVQPYYGRYPEIYAMRRDRKPFLRSYFNMLASLLNTGNLSLWEHFNNVGAWNKTHETGYFLQQTRMMLVNEYGDELWLAPLAPSEWFRDGCRIVLDRAPTAFGPAGFRIESRPGQGYIQAEITPPSRQTPQAVVLCVHHPEGAPVRRVTVDGEHWEDFDARKGTIRLPGASRQRQSVRVYFED